METIQINLIKYLKLLFCTSTTAYAVIKLLSFTLGYVLLKDIRPRERWIRTQYAAYTSPVTEENILLCHN